MTIATAPTRRRRPFWQLVRTEAILLLRTPAAALWTVVIPIAAITVLSIVPATNRPAKALHGITYLNAYLPIVMVFTLLMCGISLLPSVLSTYREKGILRRLATTPVAPGNLLGAQALLYLGIGIVVDIVLLVIAIASGVPVPHQLPGFVLSLLLVALTMLGLGLLITAVAPTARVASAFGAALLFPLMFFAGLWVPRASMPHVLRTISDYTPLGAGVRAVQASIAGQWPSNIALLVMVAYAVACGLLAARWFRWE